MDNYLILPYISKSKKEALEKAILDLVEKEKNEFENRGGGWTNNVLNEGLYNVFKSIAVVRVADADEDRLAAKGDPEVH